MRFYRPLILTLFFTLPFAAGFSRGVSTPAPSPTASEKISEPSPSPTPSQMPGIQFNSVAYYSTVAERAKIQTAALAVARTIASPCFADFMSARKLIQTNGRTPPQVVDHIRGLAGIVPIEMYYRRFGSAVAYRNEGSPTIHLNRRAFGTSMTDCEWGATMAHESLHVYGYGHDYNWSASRSYSVPYSVGGGDRAQGGDAFGKCCK